MNRVRAATVVGMGLADSMESDKRRVEALLPENYGATWVSIPGEKVLLIVGTDVAGWTMEDYVIPRLASDMIYVEEIGNEL